MNIGNPVPTTSIVNKEGFMLNNFRTWTQQISRLSILEGAGSPEGVIPASPTRMYMDTTGPSGAVLYIKQTGTGNTGWEASGGGGGASSYSFNRVIGVSTQAVTGTGAAITWDSSADSFGSDVTFDGGQPTRLTAVTTGVYKIGGYFALFSTGARPQGAVMIYKNGSPLNSLLRSTSYIRNSGAAWDFWPLEISNTPLSLNAGDYIEIFIGQVTLGAYAFGGSLTVTIHRDKSEMFLERLA